MSLITTKYRVFRITHRHFDGTQYLQKVWYLGRWKIWTWIVDQEEVPAFVAIDLGCFGAQHDWRSKFSEHIRNQNNRT